MDGYIIVCVKPAGVLSTDEPGGVPELLREQLGDSRACVRTVHRLDRVVGGVMLLARTRMAASLLSEQVRDRSFHKEYLAVVHGTPAERRGTLRDLLARDPRERRTYVTHTPGPDAREAVLDYETLSAAGELSLLRITLHTGRTHQIRVQFSSRGMPLVGDRKYGAGEDCGIALWSSRLCFTHPKTGEPVDVSLPPPAQYPWTEFQTEG